MKIYNLNSNENQSLILDRNMSFEEADFYIEHAGLLDDIVHPNTSEYPNQRIFIVRIEDFVYLAPYVETEE